MRVTNEMRDIAGTAGSSAGAIYIRIGRKDHLTDVDRGTLLNWIDSAIGDLESLKRMLNGEDATRVRPLVREDNSTKTDQ